MEKAPPEAEILHQHFFIRLGKVYNKLCVISLIFLILGVYCAFTKELYANKENFFLNETFLMKEREARGFTGRVTLREAITATFHNDHPLHYLLWTPYNWLSYTVGSRIHNYCNKTDLLTDALPSLYRSFEFVSSTQVFLRSAVLISLCVRIFLSIVMGHYVYFLLGGRLFVRIIAFFLPVLDGAWMTFAVLILCFQTNETDGQITLPLMYWNFPLFAACFVAYGLLYITLTGFTFKRIALPSFQFACILTFTWCYAQIHTDYWAYLKPLSKPCYLEVPFDKAFYEYFAVLCVLFFVFSQFHELSPFIGSITLLKMEYDCYFEPRHDYTPVYVCSTDSIGSLHSQDSTRHSTTS